MPERRGYYHKRRKVKGLPYKEKPAEISERITNYSNEEYRALLSDSALAALREGRPNLFVRPSFSLSVDYNKLQEPLTTNNDWSSATCAAPWPRDLHESFDVITSSDSGAARDDSTSIPVSSAQEIYRAIVADCNINSKDGSSDDDDTKEEKS